MLAHAILCGALLCQTEEPLPAGYTLPTLDLAHESWRQVVVDREPGQYLGHPTTVLLEDQRTLIVVYPKGHGRGAIVMKRSSDAGLTWSERLPVPDSWASSKETPTIHRVEDAQGHKRLILFSGLYPIRMALSEDDGASWSELEPIGDFGGIVTMSAVERVGPGRYIALFHDDGRFLRGAGERSRFDVFQIESNDGGRTWSQPRSIAHRPDVHLCEPGLVRSPDGRTLAVLLRENSRTRNSWVIFSEDEGASWSEPRELPAALTGDRHQGRYAPDGRLFLSFRDRTRQSPTHGDWVGWVGTWDDLVQGREGQYRVRLMDNLRGADCAYPAVERLPDGTFVCTTYGHWTAGEPAWIASVRFTLDELDRRARAQHGGPALPPRTLEPRWERFDLGLDFHALRLDAVAQPELGRVLGLVSGDGPGELALGAFQLDPPALIEVGGPDDWELRGTPASLTSLDGAPALFAWLESAQWARADAQGVWDAFAGFEVEGVERAPRSFPRAIVPAQGEGWRALALAQDASGRTRWDEWGTQDALAWRRTRLLPQGEGAPPHAAEEPTLVRVSQPAGWLALGGGVWRQRIDDGCDWSLPFALPQELQGAAHSATALGDGRIAVLFHVAGSWRVWVGQEQALPRLQAGEALWVLPGPYASPGTRGALIAGAEGELRIGVVDGRELWVTTLSP